MPPPTPAPTLTDADVPEFVADLGVPGIVDVHVHLMPEPVQQAVWRHFDRLERTWPVHYRVSEPERLATLAALGVRHHTALAYAHRPGMAAWLNEHTLGLAAAHPQVIPTFTIYPEPEVEAYTAAALARGGACVKVHLQVGHFDATDPRLDPAWRLLEQAATPIVLHAGAVDDGSGGAEFCGPRPVERLLERFAELRLVIAHLGAPDYDAFVTLAEAHPHVRLDTTMVFAEPAYLSGPPWHLAERLGALGDRVLFGSDFPTIPYAFSDQVAGLAALGLGDQWLAGVLWGNGAELFGLTSVPPSGANTGSPSGSAG